MYRMDLEDGNYSPSDSENEYTENELRLLKNVRNKDSEHSESEDEVLGVGPDGSSSDEDKSDLAASDIEGQDEDDNLPDVRAWGKDKRKYYKTDYVDPDYGGFQGKDADLAELEEEEAKDLQKRLVQELDDADFGLDLIVKKVEDSSQQIEEFVKSDISQLSAREKLQLLRKDSPEFFNLIDDFEAKMLILKNYLYPIIQQHKDGVIPKCQAMDFVQVYFEIILNYATNIYMYLLLKSSKANNLQNHPIIKRLLQYRQLLLQLEPVFIEIIKPQIELLLQGNVNNDNLEPDKAKTKTLKFLANLKSNSFTNTEKRVQFMEGPLPKKVKLVNEQKSDLYPVIGQSHSSDSSDIENMNGKIVEQNNDISESSKRAITYEMAKNKGLTPHRKKEQRNPRVKHRMKYRKAIIRRKGAVREPRKELSKYAGEISGIKASVSKSVKIK